ncbi:MAG: PfkB domain protein [Holophagaceae bacterium]|nr:PfkB domain protein [Holophagaceae bacterium]
MPVPTHEVVVVGCAGVDTQVYLPDGRLELGQEGHFSENLDCAGQAGTYASRSYARLGWRTAFIGCLGEDWADSLVREALASEGINLEGLFVDPAGTARSVNLMFRDGRRINFYDGKGHAGLSPDLGHCRQLLRSARLAHFAIPDWARQLLPLARELGVPIACDLQDIVLADDPYRQAFIQAADYLFFSAANHPDPFPLMERLLEASSGNLVLCGMGRRGCAVATREGYRQFPAVELPMPVVDTNGAGDCLAAGFLTSFVLEGRPLEESVKRAQIGARHACTLRASSSGLISSDQLESWSEVIP